jgi:hypothetical protein
MTVIWSFSSTCEMVSGSELSARMHATLEGDDPMPYADVRTSLGKMLI